MHQEILCDPDDISRFADTWLRNSLTGCCFIKILTIPNGISNSLSLGDSFTRNNQSNNINKHPLEVNLKTRGNISQTRNNRSLYRTRGKSGPLRPAHTRTRHIRISIRISVILLHQVFCNSLHALLC